ncbi:uncharacterized protein LOC131302978 [Rhododendron vialii]|uniref:uncharacterized protein LOC131302978 n=1 Tax=Rhododendron vialii TaxID=182163 RepID=UPI00265DFAA8|nr:uncharacterized protein LOC131302978 [Rhododendron vialii]
MLRACALDFKGSWEWHLPLVEFAYNNSYQSTIDMAPYEALYGRPCRSPVCWAEFGEANLLGPEPRKGVIRFGKKGKLSPRYIGPSQILEKIGEVAYSLALPPQLDRVHNVFHVSMLRKYITHPSHNINWENIKLNEDVTLEEQLVEIQDYSEKCIRGKTIQLVRILWRHRGIKESTWERADTMCANYPNLFPPKGKTDFQTIFAADVTFVSTERYSLACLNYL